MLKMHGNYYMIMRWKALADSLCDETSAASELGIIRNITRGCMQALDDELYKP